MKDISMFFWPGRFLCMTPSLKTSMHQHHAIQITLSLADPFKIRFSKDVEFKEYRYIIIDSNCPHEFMGEGQYVFLYFDPESFAGVLLREKYLSEQTTNEFEIENSIVSKIVNCCITPTQEKTAYQVTNMILPEQVAERKANEERILKIIEYLNGQLDKDIDIKSLANKVFISESRLMHLFKLEVGIPIRKYILWSRLALAVKNVLEGQNLTEASYTAGFSDSPHFSRTFKEMFGIAPSDIFKNSRYIQVITSFKD